MKRKRKSLDVDLKPRDFRELLIAMRDSLLGFPAAEIDQLLERETVQSGSPGRCHTTARDQILVRVLTA